MSSRDPTRDPFDPEPWEGESTIVSPGVTDLVPLYQHAMTKSVPTLQVEQGDHQGELFLLPSEGDQLDIYAGRDAGLPIRVRDGSISRKHARFSVRDEGGERIVAVEDLGSTNGTRLGLRRLEAPATLSDGDRVTLGDVVLLFRMMDPAEAELARKQQERARRAIRDPLTQLYNRRFLDRRMGALVRVAREEGRALSAIMVDLDHFKRVNDLWGHIAGDNVLMRVSEVIQRCIRAGDIAARWGGEEFCVLLPGADLTVAKRVAERIREAIEELDVADILEGEGVTASLGAATLGRSERAHAWLSRADTALYDAKHGGRNRVVAPADPSATGSSPAWKAMKRR